MQRARSRPAAVAVLLFLGASASIACSGSATAPMAAPVLGADTSSSTTMSLDGGPGATRGLRIGLLLPLTGPGAELGTALRAAAEFAIDQVNEAGGVGGRPVTRVVRDEGADIETATRSLASLIDSGVDAIVGPASSNIIGSTLPVTTEAGVLTCSPTASALALDDVPDAGLFVRTIPSDRLQASALARLVERSGERRVALLYLDDPFGRSLAEAVREELRSFAEVVAVVPFVDTDAQYGDQAAAVVASAPRATIVVGEATAGPRMVEALFDQAGLEGDVYIGDAMRVPAAANVYARLGSDALDRLIGVSPTSAARAPEFIEAFRLATGSVPELFAGNAADCVTLIALAAQAAQSPEATLFAREIAEVSHAGTECNTFAECSAALDASRNIDFDGSTNELRIGPDGDLVRGLFDVFRFGRGGRAVGAGGPPLLVGG